MPDKAAETHTLFICTPGRAWGWGARSDVDSNLPLHLEWDQKGRLFLWSRISSDSKSPYGFLINTVQANNPASCMTEAAHSHHSIPGGDWPVAAPGIPITAQWGACPSLESLVAYMGSRHLVWDAGPVKVERQSEGKDSSPAKYVNRTEVVH